MPSRGKFRPGKSLAGENFRHLANILPLFPDESFSSDIMNIFDLN